MATTQIRSAVMLGPLEAAAAGTLAMATTTTYLGIGISLSETKTLSKVMIYCTTAAAGLGASDLTCDVYDSSSGAPGSSLASSATVTTTPTNLNTPMWVEFTGFSYSLTGGKIYWIVFKNANAGVSLTYQWFSGGQTLFPTNSSGSTSPWSKRHTTDGSAWTAGNAGNASGIRLEFSDGSFEGLPYQASTTSGTDYVYDTRELGSYFTTPANTYLNVRGLGMYLFKAGTTTKMPVFKLYSGASPSLLGTTQEVGTATTDFTTAAFRYGYFAAPIALSSSTIYRAVIGETQPGDASSGNRYNSNVYTIQNSAASKALMFWGAQKTYYNGSVWAETDTMFIPFSLILDTDTPFL